MYKFTHAQNGIHDTWAPRTDINTTVKSLKTYFKEVNVLQNFFGISLFLLFLTDLLRSFFSTREKLVSVGDFKYLFGINELFVFFV